MDEEIKAWTLRFPTKENPNMEEALLNIWPIMLQYDVTAKYQLISRKFFGNRASSFFARVFAQPTKGHTSLYLFNKPIKLLYLHLFVVPVLFRHFHLKVIRKSLYLNQTCKITSRFKCWPDLHTFWTSNFIGHHNFTLTTVFLLLSLVFDILVLCVLYFHNIQCWASTVDKNGLETTGTRFFLLCNVSNSFSGWTN